MYVSPRLNDLNCKLESLHSGLECRARSFDPWAWSLVFGLVLSAFVLGSPLADRAAQDPGATVDQGGISRHGTDPCLVTPARSDLVGTLPTSGGLVRVSG